MVANPERRDRLTDAGLAVLAAGGARALTHRAVDREAGVPVGTSANYFRSRDELLAALGRRVFERLAPDPDRLAELVPRPADLSLFTDYMHDIVARATADPDLLVALFELRLEGRRRPRLAAELARTLRRGFEADVEFADGAGFPVRPADIALMHYALDGLLLDLLTTSIGAGVAPADAVRELTHRLVGGAWQRTGSPDPEGTGPGGPESRPDGSRWLSDALDAGVEGPFLVAAYYVDDGQGARLCAGILESFPPQCGEPSLRLGDTAAIDDRALTTEGGVTWSVEPVTVEGEITGDTFVPR